MAAIVAVGMCATLVAAPHASAQQLRNRASGAARAIPTPVVMAKVYKRPLLRPGRVQYCLKAARLYDGRIDGRLSLATQRALRKFRDDLQLKVSDVGQDWALHAALWRQCREHWTADGGALDRFGLGLVGSARQRADGVARFETAAANVAPAEPKSSLSAAAVPTTVQIAAGACFTAEHRDLLSKAQGRPSALPVCGGPCLPLPSTMDREDAQAYERSNGVTWCRVCVPIASSMALDEIARIEQAGNVTLCPIVRRQQRAFAAEPSTLVADELRGTRALFRRDLRPAELHNGFAVIVSLARYAGLPTRARAERDAAGMQAVLTERMGFRSGRIIVLKDPPLDELEGVFGRSGSAKGLLSERLQSAVGSPLFVYISGLGSIGDGDGGAYILASDAQRGRERSRGLAVETLYQNLTAIGAGPITVVLEADFAGDPKGPLISPNAPVTRSSALPHLAIRGLSVIAAGDRDQRLLEDTETGLSLFTRHFIAAISGHADKAPVGNGDGRIDTAEAFVYAAERTSFVARKLVGVLQRPTISQGRSQPIVQLGAVTRP